ncbi:MAG: DUF3572 domain-containing protein, partial [Verrucomicrobiae bacterium]|nr:DUF3572 domain-containing protein [Verrucomicrobiae bacterium]
SSDQMGRFLSLTGIGPSDLSAALDDPALLAAVLEHIIGDEPLLLQLSANRNISPEDIILAWDLLTLAVAEQSRK